VDQVDNNPLMQSLRQNAEKDERMIAERMMMLK